MKVENVKAVIKDIDGLYLVGESSYPDSNAYSFLGGHSEKDETPFETLGREIMEESSMVLDFSYDDKKGFYIKDANHNRVDLVFNKIATVDKKWFVFFDVDQALSLLISSWQDQFRKNQNKIIMDAVGSLLEIYPTINWLKLFGLFRNRKFSEIKNVLDRNLSKGQVKNIIQYMKDVGYYLENKNLILTDEKDLRNKIYEKEALFNLS